jgi:hypothetical protein
MTQTKPPDPDPSSHNPGPNPSQRAGRAANAHHANNHLTNALIVTGITLLCSEAGLAASGADELRSAQTPAPQHVTIIAGSDDGNGVFVFRRRGDYSGER